VKKAIRLLPIILGLLLPSIVMAATGSTDSQTAKLLAAVRKATHKYHDADVAIADGYLPMSPCEENMGIHFVNLALAFDPAVNEFQPEILLYVPTDEGFKLVGVEYFTFPIGTVGGYVGPWFSMELPEGWVWLTPTPTLYNRPMDGPMEPHAEGVMPWHYDLHVYLWQANPNGIFEEWNPTVKC